MRQDFAKHFTNHEKGEYRNGQTGTDGVNKGITAF